MVRNLKSATDLCFVISRIEATNDIDIAQLERMKRNQNIQTESRYDLFCNLTLVGLTDWLAD